jgi:hypothetical protein
VVTQHTGNSLGVIIVDVSFADIAFRSVRISNNGDRPSLNHNVLSGVSLSLTSQNSKGILDTRPPFFGFLRKSRYTPRHLSGRIASHSLIGTQLVERARLLDPLPIKPVLRAHIFLLSAITKGGFQYLWKDHQLNCTALFRFHWSIALLTGALIYPVHISTRRAEFSVFLSLNPKTRPIATFTPQASPFRPFLGSFVSASLAHIYLTHGSTPSSTMTLVEQKKHSALYVMTICFVNRSETTVKNFGIERTKEYIISQ